MKLVSGFTAVLGLAARNGKSYVLEMDFPTGVTSAVRATSMFLTARSLKTTLR